MMIAHHRDRGRRHRQDHDAIAGHGAEQRHEIGRLTHDGAPWPAMAAVLRRRALCWNSEADKRAGRCERDDREQQKGADIFGSEQRAAEAGQHRPGQRGDDAARQNERDRARTERLVGHLAGGEAIELGKGLIGPDEERAAGQQRQRAERDSCRRDDAAGHAEQRSDDEAHAASDPGHPHRGRKGHGGGTEEHRRDGHRRQFGARSDLGAGKAAHRHDQDRGGLKQRLRAGEKEDLPVHRGARHQSTTSPGVDTAARRAFTSMRPGCAADRHRAPSRGCGSGPASPESGRSAASGSMDMALPPAITAARFIQSIC